ncbi:hypothetical protein CUMW_228070 [Citrus unshiu]|uniref:Disease resistance protein At4g27190-like leucine-rich repeats domain-containing protein n=1 Tax=Citrus unshiu TaxID=55188 RepID=A0A2H5QGL1_CITUN|nr:hypothetical protein CUMW_228070 [Citrus unshiu]
MAGTHSYTIVVEVVNSAGLLPHIAEFAMGARVALPKLENLELRSINVERIWQNQFSAISSGVQNLMHLTLYRCRNLRCLFSSSIVSNDIFVRLQHLEILGCPVLEEIITVDQEKRNNNILFPNFEELRADAKHIATNNSLFPEDLICKLKCLEAEFGAESPTIFSLDDILQRFHAMKVLRIGGGRHAQEAKEKAENGMEVIIREVNKCFDLKHFLKQGSVEKSATKANFSTAGMQALEKIQNMLK